MNNWIKVEDWLPDVDATVLVFSNFGEIFTCKVRNIIEENSKPVSKSGVRERVSHWQSLPDPPKT